MKSKIYIIMFSYFMLKLGNVGGDILFGSIRPYLHKAGFAPFDGVVAGTVHSFKPINNNYYNFS
ncbi:hypothetical protein, partial [Mycoplasmopsis bovis]|uniref:hypothetical protein n=1 Tax=Mycoplasmopsis bovis TaxID=28903 RepID=UPI003D29EC64